MFRYKTSKIKELIASRKIRKVDLRRHFGYSNDVTINRWEKGEDIYVSKLEEICNLTKTSILEFFEFDEKDIKPYGIHTPQESETASMPVVENGSIEYILKKEREITDIRLKHQSEMFALKESFLKDLTQNTLKLKEEERDNLDKQRMQDWERFNEKMKEKDQELNQLKESLLEMQMQYKELELSIPQTKQRITAQKLANEPGTTYQKK